MNNEEKIYHKIKEAAHKDSEASFPSIEKVWNRVEEKLDNSQIKKKSEVWKKLSIAASFLLFFMIGYQLFQNQEQLEKPLELNKPNSENKVIPENSDSNKIEENNQNQVKINTQKANSNTKAIVFPNSITLVQNDVAVVYEKASSNEISDDKIVKEEQAKISADVELISKAEAINRGYMNTASTNNPDFFNNRKIYEAVIIKSSFAPQNNTSDSEVSIQQKSSDLVLIDGKLSKKTKDEINLEEYEIKLELSNPLYIINGEEFSEESLFGEKPTSPYAPLNKQKIKELNVIEPKDAKAIYGEKGKNGVVIITIKK